VSAGLASELDDQVAEAVHDDGVLVEVRGGLDVSDRS
jgi:hypothetical protein